MVGGEGKALGNFRGLSCKLQRVKIDPIHLHQAAGSEWNDTTLGIAEHGDRETTRIVK